MIDKSIAKVGYPTHAFGGAVVVARTTAGPQANDHALQESPAREDHNAGNHRTRC